MESANLRELPSRASNILALIACSPGGPSNGIAARQLHGSIAKVVER